MQIKLFSIPIHGGESIGEDLNAFLRSKKILQVEQHLVSLQDAAYWCFAVRYLESGGPGELNKPRIDYKEVLDEATFARFSKLREIRKKVAQEEAIPAYAVFTDEELAGLAQLEKLTAETMRSIKGIGEKKVERYAKYFIETGTTL
ncbi:MAG: HRDC domain-containing protein [Saprospiraceae bacterium]|nr:HRDC domain-containing protein [Saprospiraceae bacterium]